MQVHFTRLHASSQISPPNTSSEKLGGIALHCPWLGLRACGYDVDTNSQCPTNKVPLISELTYVLSIVLFHGLSAAKILMARNDVPWTPHPASIQC
jgi:hypothetical protein